MRPMWRMRAPGLPFKQLSSCDALIVTIDRFLFLCVRFTRLGHGVRLFSRFLALHSYRQKASGRSCENESTGTGTISGQVIVSI